MTRYNNRNQGEDCNTAMKNTSFKNDKKFRNGIMNLKVKLSLRFIKHNANEDICRSEGIAPYILNIRTRWK